MQGRFNICSVFHHVRAYRYFNPPDRYKSHDQIARHLIQFNATEETRRSTRYVDRKRKKDMRIEQYGIYIYNNVLKQLHPYTGISSNALSIMNSLCTTHLKGYPQRRLDLNTTTNDTPGAAEKIQTSDHLILQGVNTKHAVSEGTKAVTKYTSINS